MTSISGIRANARRDLTGQMTSVGQERRARARTGLGEEE